MLFSVQKAERYATENKKIEVSTTADNCQKYRVEFGN